MNPPQDEDTHIIETMLCVVDRRSYSLKICGFGRRIMTSADLLRILLCMKTLILIFALILISCAPKKTPNTVYIRPEGSGPAKTPQSGGEFGKAHGYPEDWWTPVTDKPLFEGEVFPQAAKEGEVVLSSRTELGILSNFAATTFVYKKKTYASVEGFWQSMLFPDPMLTNDIRESSSALSWSFTRSQVAILSGEKVRRAGVEGLSNMNKLAIDWVSFEGNKMTYKEQGNSEFYILIRVAMIEKFMQNQAVCEVLHKTGDLKLVADFDTSKNPAKAWNYFDIWMDLRAQYKNFDCASIH